MEEQDSKELPPPPLLLLLLLFAEPPATFEASECRMPLEIKYVVSDSIHPMQTFPKNARPASGYLGAQTVLHVMEQ